MYNVEVGTSFVNNVSLGRFLEFFRKLVSVLIAEILSVRNVGSNFDLYVFVCVYMHTYTYIHVCICM